MIIQYIILMIFNISATRNNIVGIRLYIDFVHIIEKIFN